MLSRVPSEALSGPSAPAPLRLTHALPTAHRMLVILVITAVLAVGMVVNDSVASSRAVVHAGDELTRLLRAMAVLKAAMAAIVAAAVLWRLGTGISAAWLAAYALACAAIAAGPALIWSMAHVGVGALLSHAGLLAALLLLWRDPVVAKRLAALVTARRARLASGRSVPSRPSSKMVG